jgi:hypothetical protein
VKAILGKMIIAMVVLMSFSAVSPVSLAAKENWQALEGFTPLLSEMTQFSQRYVVIPFVNQEDNMTAAVFFAATCDSAGCALERRAGYAITNPEGSDVKLYIDPRDRELIALVQEFSMSRFNQN